VYAGDVRVSQPQDFSRIVSRPPSSISMDKVPHLPMYRTFYLEEVKKSLKRVAVSAWLVPGKTGCHK
jgi:hypothetical protein